MTQASKRAYEKLTAFVDWNSQLLLSKYDYSKDPKEAARKTLNLVGKRISYCLSKLSPSNKFAVDIRLYHGWHKGFEPSANRKAIDIVISETDFAALSLRSNVLFTGNVKYGDCLISARTERLHTRLAIHLPNTFRSQRRGRERTEKMVDTALSADLLTTAYEEPTRWVMVVTEDDDMVPPLFVAENILERHGSRALLLRSRSTGSNFLKLDGILVGDK